MVVLLLLLVVGIGQDEHPGDEEWQEHEDGDRRAHVESGRGRHGEPPSPDRTPALPSAETLKWTHIPWAAWAGTRQTMA